MKRIATAVLLICVGVFALAQNAHGSFLPGRTIDYVGFPPGRTINYFGPRPWHIRFEEYDRIFFMTPPTSETLVRIYGEERMQIPTGLYYDTDPLVNIYRVYEDFGWNFPDQFFFSNCGRYFAHMWEGAPDMDFAVLQFFANGQPVLSYAAGDFVDNLRFSRGAYRWLSPEDWSDQQQNILSIRVVDGRSFSFDITTGEMVYPYQPGLPLPNIVNRVVALIAAAIAAMVVIAFKFVSHKPLWRPSSK